MSPGDEPPPAVGGKAWRYFEGALPGIAANLALDEALLIEADERGAGPALRIWEPDGLAVVLGASGRWREDVNVPRLRGRGRRRGASFQRWRDGGGRSRHAQRGGDPPRDRRAGPGGRRYSAGLRTGPDGAGPSGRIGPAVERLGSGDLTLERRKFSGSAQRRLRNHFLVHATLLYQFPLALVERYTRVPRRQPAYRENRSHAEFLVNLDLPRALLVSAIQGAWLPPDHDLRPAALPGDLVAELVRTKFADPAWTERL